MAQLTAETIVRKLVYQKDATGNVQEAPGGAHVVPADGSTAVAATIGKATSIFTVPQPGKGFPTGKDATHTTGTYPRLVTAVIQQSTDTISIDAATRAGVASPALVSPGMSVVADAHSHAGVNDLENSLQNDTSAMALGNASVPAKAAGAALIDGLSQSPETQG